MRGRVVTPVAPDAAQAKGVRGCRALLVGAGISFGLGISAIAAVARDDLKPFDIPAQALSSALEAFSSASGYQLLVAETVPPSLRSQQVQGTWAPRDALARLIVGTGFEVTYTSAQAAILRRSAEAEQRVAQQRQSRIHYEAALQSDVTQVLCRDSATRPGSYRAALDLWVAPSGQVTRAELLGSTGSEGRDRQIVAALQVVTSAAPPDDVPQPTTLVVLPKPAGAHDLCAAGFDEQRASRR
jgi:hypothetical protein